MLDDLVALSCLFNVVPRVQRVTDADVLDEPALLTHCRLAARCPLAREPHVRSVPHNLAKAMRLKVPLNMLQVDYRSRSEHRAALGSTDDLNVVPT